MIPLCLVTGFLGSGKTTLLEQQWQRYLGQPIAFIINEYAQFAVDPLRFSPLEGSLTCIPGGSIFCQCRVTEFMDALKRIACGTHSSGMPFKGAIIEASGMANPSVIRSLLQETRLDRAFNLTSVASIIDPASFGKLLETLPVIVEQIAASNTALINKIDLHDETVLRDVECLLLQINPSLRIQRVKFAATNLDLLEPVNDSPPGIRLHGECARTRFASYAVMTNSVVDFHRLKILLDESGQFLYRAKGVLNGDGGACFIDYSSGRWSSAPVFDMPDQRGLVLIGDDEDKIKELGRRIRE